MGHSADVDQLLWRPDVLRPLVLDNGYRAFGRRWTASGFLHHLFGTVTIV